MKITVIIKNSNKEVVNSILSQSIKPDRLVLFHDKPNGFVEREVVGLFVHGYIGKTLVSVYGGELDGAVNKVVDAFRSETDIFAFASKSWKGNKLAKLSRKIAENPKHIGIVYNDSVNVYRMPYHIMKMPNSNDYGDFIISKEAVSRLGALSDDLFVRTAQAGLILVHLAEVLDC